MIFLTQQNKWIEKIYIDLFPSRVRGGNLLNSMISNGTIWFILAGVVIIIIAIIFAIKKRKKK